MTNASRSLKTPDPHELDEDTLEYLVEAPFTKEWDRAILEKVDAADDPLAGLSAHRITPRLLAKLSPESERANTNFVRAMTRIPVPQLRYPHLASSMWIVQDYIEGKMLFERWDTLSYFMQFRVACTLRGYISQLRRLRRSYPGTVDTGHTGGVIFNDVQIGPVESADKFRALCESSAYSSWAKAARYRLHCNEAQLIEPPPYMKNDWTLVFTHGDLNPTNLLLSNDGVLWVIDWQTSGFYPIWMELVGLSWSDRWSRSWQRYYPFMAGRYHRSVGFWSWALGDISRWQVFTNL